MPIDPRAIEATDPQGRAAGALTDLERRIAALERAGGVVVPAPPNGAAGGDLFGTYPNPRSRAVRAYARARGTGQITAPTGGWTKYGYGTEEHDTDGAYDVGNTQYVAPVNGIYLVHATLRIFSVISNAHRFILAIWRSGSTVQEINRQFSSNAWSNDGMLSGSGLIYADVGNPIDIRLNHNVGVSISIGDTGSYFQCLLLRDLS